MAWYCYSCGKEIHFDPNIKSKNGKSIPLSGKTGTSKHRCPAKPFNKETRRQWWRSQQQQQYQRQRQQIRQDTVSDINIEISTSKKIQVSQKGFELIQRPENHAQKWHKLRLKQGKRWHFYITKHRHKLVDMSEKNHPSYDSQPPRVILWLPFRQRAVIWHSYSFLLLLDFYHINWVTLNLKSKNMRRMTRIRHPAKMAYHRPAIYQEGSCEVMWIRFL